MRIFLPFTIAVLLFCLLGGTATACPMDVVTIYGSTKYVRFMDDCVKNMSEHADSLYCDADDMLNLINSKSRWAMNIQSLLNGMEFSEWILYDAEINMVHYEKIKKAAKNLSYITEYIYYDPAKPIHPKNPPHKGEISYYLNFNSEVNDLLKEINCRSRMIYESSYDCKQVLCPGHEKFKVGIFAKPHGHKRVGLVQRLENLIGMGPVGPYNYTMFMEQTDALRCEIEELECLVHQLARELDVDP